MNKLKALMSVLIVCMLLLFTQQSADALPNLRIIYTGGATNTTPSASLGGIANTTSGGELSSTSMNNMFPNAVGTELVSDYKYYAYVLWNDGDETATNVQLFMETETSSTGTQLDFYVLSTTMDSGDSLDTLSNNEDSTGISGTPSFTHYTLSSPASLVNIGVNRGVGFYVRRKIQNASSTTQDLGTIGAQCD